MATLKGVNNTKAEDPTSANITDAGLLEGKVRVMQDSYEASAAAIADIIKMGKILPKNAHVIEVVLHTDALGASVTLDVGDYEDPDRYMTAVDCSAVTIERIEAAQIDGRHYKCDDTTPGDTTTDRQIRITIAGAAATGTIKLTVYYTGTE